MLASPCSIQMSLPGNSFASLSRSLTLFAFFSMNVKRVKPGSTFRAILAEPSRKRRTSGSEMSGNNLKISGIINLPSLGSLSGGKLLCPEQYIEGFASVPVGIVENRPRVPLLNSIEPSIGWSHPMTKKGDACSLPTWQANLVEEPSNT